MFGLQFVNEVSNMQREMDQFLRELGFASASENPLRPIKFEVTEKENSHSVKALLPGLNSESLNISVLGRRLTIAGEFTEAEVPEGSHWYRQERQRGKFEQNIQLATDLDVENIEAEYIDGVLRIDLPKAVSALPKKIALKVNE
ncbi:HSP20 family protein [Desulfuromusa kysingii]|uniref:HSP20 family protein n=1 Tax=Desulfuromusa kysingii TaxID=37625 RepID=A0A1H4DZC0_9BACT|nr:Hsp20/alpha crystallin family protein [Desulfuromusa kysingii]SEA77927.1 HSP20 family protein [Desulfuromusa kysingii]